MQSQSQSASTTGKRKAVEVSSLLDYTAECVVQDAMDANLDMVKSLILKDGAILRQVATDDSFLAELIKHANELPFNRPVNNAETVSVVRCEEDADCTESVTMYLKDLPGFLSPCIGAHIATVFEPCLRESDIVAEHKVLDLSDTDTLRDFIDISNGGKEARNYVLKSVYSKGDAGSAPMDKRDNNGWGKPLFTPTSPAYDPAEGARKKQKNKKEKEEDDGGAGKKQKNKKEDEEDDEDDEDDEDEEAEEDEEDKEDEEAEEDKEDDEDEEDDVKKILSLLRRDPSTLTAGDEETLDEAFGECIDDFTDNMMEDKDALWKLLTQSGPAKGWHAPSRFTVRIHMSE
tara:strand:+ start:1910 stop:2944 length:1035 start_codon:yes stop_codon:yes gene_type:complete